MAPEQYNQFGAGGGHDINVESVWDTTTGEGINVVIVDDGLDFDHLDLKDNVITANNHDYNGNNNIFNPFLTHGTRVAGLIAASHNDIGVRGVAPKAKIYVYNLLGARATISLINSSYVVDAMVRNMESTAVSNNSWGLSDDGNYSPTSVLWDRGVEQGITDGFDGKGIVYVWAGGIGGSLDNSNLDEFANFYGITAVAQLIITMYEAPFRR